MTGGIAAVVLVCLQSGASKIITLDDDLTPASLDHIIKYRGFVEGGEKVADIIEKMSKTNEKLAPDDRKHIGSKTPVAVGSKGKIYTDKYGIQDKGLFSTIFNAYSNHWSLKTTPDDWWFTIIRKVALDIDKTSKEREVRDFFVSHEGKKELVVDLGTSVYTANYSRFFNDMTEKVGENIKNPNYTRITSSNFSTSSNIHQLISHIALLSSVQEYFTYTSTILCGIPRVDMQGTEGDWELLIQKLNQLKEYLKPISNITGLTEWWDKAHEVLKKLLETYREEPDKEWWSRIVTEKGYRGCGGPPESFTGWFVDDFLDGQPKDQPSGLVSVPMKITDGDTEEMSAIVAGIPGFDIDITPDVNVTWIQAAHAWTLMLEPNSTFRNYFAELEETNEV